MTALGVYVAKDWRDQGIGQALMARCVEWAEASPVVERVELEVYAQNARAIHLYEQFGFEREGCKRRLYYQNGSAHRHADHGAAVGKASTGETMKRDKTFFQRDWRARTRAALVADDALLATIFVALLAMIVGAVVA